MTGVLEVQEAIDGNSCGYWLHYVIFLLYASIVVVHAISLALQIIDGLYFQKSMVVVLIYILIGFPLIVIYFVMILELIIRGGFSTGLARQSQPERRRSAMPPGTNYLTGLWELQGEIEARIAMHMGHQGDASTGKNLVPPIDVTLFIVTALWYLGSYYFQVNNKRAQIAAGGALGYPISIAT